MIPFSEEAVQHVFDNYPEPARPTMLALRDLVFTTFEKLDSDATLTETLKWGEPSYLCNTGSTLRIHWKESDPDFCRVFFHCQTKLIPTFRELYPNDLDFEDNRAIKIPTGADLNLACLSHCIELSLRYHQLKHLPRLGAP